MIFLGIDPGLEGAVATIEPGGAVVLYDTPAIWVDKGKGRRREYLVSQMSAIIKGQFSAEEPVKAAIEKVGAMPGQGVTSMFSFGRGVGIWLGILGALQVPYEEIHSRRWKAAMMPDMGKDKGASIVRACQLFPEYSALIDSHGKADALLLAEYLRRSHGPA